MRQRPQEISERKLDRAFRAHRAAVMPRTRSHITRILATEDRALADCSSAQIGAVLRLIDRAYHQGRAQIDAE